jgi:hypothetical protein
VLQGQVHGGQQPINGAHVYLFAANTSGYGNPSVSLLNATDTGHSDSVGAYVPTASDGSFTITGDYSCTTNTQVYLYVLGGDAGSGQNSAAGLMAALGNCPASNNFLSSDPVIQVNEVTTVAAAYSFAGFATDATHVSSSGTALAQIGIANAFANAANLASIVTGQALATTPAGTGAVPQSEINTLANILASCVNSAGPSSTNCSNLVTYTNGPSDTASAAINIAHNAAANVAGLYALSTGTPPFAPALAAAPNDFSIALNFSGGGIVGANGSGIAIDGLGNAWVTNAGGSSVIELSSSGSILSGASGYRGGGMGSPWGIAIDLNGNAWISTLGTKVYEISSSGSFLSGASGYQALAPYEAEAYPQIAIDGSNNVWVVGIRGGNAGDTGDGALAKLNSSGTPYSGSPFEMPFVSTDLFYQGWFSIDASGDIWAACNGAYVVEFSNAGSLLNSYPATEIGYYPNGMAIDHSGNVWVGGAALEELSAGGSALSGPSGYLTTAGTTGLAIDGSGSVWTESGQTIVAVSNAGATLTGANGYKMQTGSGTQVSFAIAVDGSGNVWIPNGYNNDLSEFIGAAVPVVTPLAAGVKNNSLGARP